MDIQKIRNDNNSEYLIYIIRFNDIQKSNYDYPLIELWYQKMRLFWGISIIHFFIV